METIAAIATPLVKSALGIIRVSGDDCFNIVQKVFNKDITSHPSRKIYIGKILDNNQKFIDEVVLLQYVSPKSYTGENLIELICHGSVLILNQVLSLLIKEGARMAQNGEFSMRAVLNKKMSLNKAEAINDFINCNSFAGLDLIKNSLEDKHSKSLFEIKNELENLVSNIEVNFDYPEYKDIEVVSIKKIKEISKSVIKKVRNLIDESTINNKIVYGVKVAIIGKPNVGKSTLLNALIGEERAITSNISGTTRDVVSSEKNIKGINFIFYDTAGIRKTKNKIEKKGIEFTKKTVEQADLVIYLYDKDDFKIVKEDSFLKKYLNKFIFVKNKNDLDKNKKIKSKDIVSISAKNQAINPLISKMFSKLNIGNANYSKSFLYNTRQIGVLKNVLENLENILKMCDSSTMDLLAVKLDETYKLILELLGLSFDEELNKNIFKNFCVGK